MHLESAYSAITFELTRSIASPQFVCQLMIVNRFATIHFSVDGLGKEMDVKAQDKVPISLPSFLFCHLPVSAFICTYSLKTPFIFEFVQIIFNTSS